MHIKVQCMSPTKYLINNIYFIVTLPTSFTNYLNTDDTLIMTLRNLLIELR